MSNGAVTEPLPVPQQLLKLRKRGLWWKLLAGILGFLLIAAGLLLGLWYYNAMALTLTLTGQQEITLECGTAFSDPGATAEFTGRIYPGTPEQLSVTVIGKVDNSKTGNYPLTYQASKSFRSFFGELTMKRSVTRVVRVVDTTPPQLTLLTDPDAYTLPGSPYREEGYTATDVNDGDLTAQVTSRQEGDKVYYTVTDSAGNAATAVRDVIYSDPVAPELSLLGDTEMLVLQGSAYVEPGCSALDNLDGDLTAQVTVTGTVDINTLGVYQLTYSVTDSFGNTASAVRNVTVRDYPALPDYMPVVEPQERVRPEGKVVYLTFDDGPSAYTAYLLDVLKKYNVKATFFVVDRGYPELLRRIVQEGHTIAMHCGEHNYGKIYASEEAYFQDLKRVQDVILAETGQLSTIVRFPGGSNNAVSKNFNTGIMTRLTKMLNAMGYRYFDWNVSSGDTGETTDPQQVFLNVTGGIMQRETAVVLQHDIKPYSVEAVEKIIQWGLKNGYTFLALDASSPTCETKPQN